MATLVLVGGSVVDVENNKVDADQTITVQDGWITAVAPRASAEIPDGAEVHDVGGRWILPGLIDMHCHLTGPMHGGMPLELFLANGVTTVRDPGGRITDQRLLRHAVESGSAVGPRLVVSGEIVDGMPPVWPAMSLIADTPARAEAAVRHLASQGADFIKVYNHVPKAVLEAIVDAARDLGLPVIGHVPRAFSMLGAIRAGMSGLEHIRITGSDFLPADEARWLDGLPVGEREPLLWERIDPDADWIGTIIDALVDMDVTLDPTLLIDDVVYGKGLAREFTHPDNAYLPETVRTEWACRPIPVNFRLPSELVNLAASAGQKRRDFVLRCAEAGVRIVAGTDGAGLGRLLPGFGLHHEMALLHEAGLPRFECLRAATTSAAYGLQLSGEIGSVAVGMVADLGIWKVDPVQHDLAVTDLEFTICRGAVWRGADPLVRSAGG